MDENNNDNPPKQPAVPHPVIQMKITILSNKTLTINGAPDNLDVALQVLADAARVTINLFIDKAKEGQLDDENNLIDTKIISPDKKVIL